MSFLDRLKLLLGGQGAPAAGGTAGGIMDTGHGALTCLEALEKLYEYLDGELEDVTEKEVQRHFSMCKKCYPHLRFEERFIRLLQESGGSEGVPPSFKEHLLELLAAEVGEGG